MSHADFKTLIYEIPEAGIARIRLNRPDRANAQDTELLYELNEAFDRAAHDNDVRVIILAAEGKHFSAGHDLGETDSAAAMARHRTVGTMCGFGCAGAEAQMAREEEIYTGFCERWRNIPKPTIAAVQGKCIACFGDFIDQGLKDGFAHGEATWIEGRVQSIRLLWPAQYFSRKGFL